MTKLMYRKISLLVAGIAQFLATNYSNWENFVTHFGLLFLGHPKQRRILIFIYFSIK